MRVSLRLGACLSACLSIYVVRLLRKPAEGLGSGTPTLPVIRLELVVLVIAMNDVLMIQNNGPSGLRSLY